MCWVLFVLSHNTPQPTGGLQDIGRFGSRKDSLTALLQGAEQKLKHWYASKGQDESQINRKRKVLEGNMTYKLRFAVDFIRDQGKVEFGEQGGVCCTARTINGHVVWRGGNKAQGFNDLLWSFLAHKRSTSAINYCIYQTTLLTSIHIAHTFASHIDKASHAF